MRDIKSLQPDLKLIFSLSRDPVWMTSAVPLRLLRSEGPLCQMKTFLAS